MRQNPLGRSGLTVSAVGLGCNNFGRRLDRAGTRAVIDAALDAGITFLDTADIYGGEGASERLIGEALEGRRDRVVLATKFGAEMGGGGEPRGSRAYARRALEASLERLRTDRVDLLYYHEPDGVTPLAETLGALAELADEGKIRAFGVSNLDAAQLREAAASSAIHGSPRCRTSTACSSAAPSGSCCRSAASTGSASCPTSRSRAGC